MKKIIHFQKHFLSLTLFIGLSFMGNAQTLNPSSISTNGSVNTIVQDSTTIYVGGSFSTVGYKASGIAKINSNALMSFDFPSVSGQCYATVSDGNGGWYGGGSFTVQGLSNLIHILADKTLDASFAPNPDNQVRALYLDGTTLYVGGSFTQINSQSQSRLAAINSSTGILKPWNPAPDGPIYSIMKNGNTVYVGGSFNNVCGRQNRNFAAIDAITASAIPAISASSTVNAIEQDAANLYLGGIFSGNSGFYTGSTSLLTTASDLPDLNFPVIGSGTVYKSVPDGSGGWYVGGSFTVQGLSNLIHIIADKTLDASFAPNPNNQVRALYLDGTTLYVGGSFTQINSQLQSRLAAINSSTGILQPWNPAPDGPIYSIMKNGNTVYVGGSFNNVCGRQNRNFAAIDAITASAIPAISASSTINAIEQDAANLYLGGVFSGNSGFYTGSTSLLTTASDLPDLNFPVIGSGTVFKSIPDGSRGWYVGGSFTVQGLSNLIHILADKTLDASFAPNPNNQVRALYLDGTTLYVGGSFTQINSQSQSRLAAINSSTGILKPWNPAPDGPIYSIMKNGNTVYVGGSFNNVCGRQNRNFAAIDAITASAIPAISASSTVNAIEQDAANLYLGGVFSGNNGFYTGSTSLLTTASDLPDLNFPVIGSGTVYKSVPDGSGGWYVGGSFTVQGLSNLIHILADKTLDASFAPNPNNQVRALYLDGTTLYVGGSFTQINYQLQSRLAAINSSIGILKPWNPAPDGPIYSIMKNGNTVYVGGSFNNVCGRQNRNFAAIDAITASAIPAISASSTVNAIEQDAVNLYLGGVFSGNSGFYTGSTSLLTTASDLPDLNFPVIGSGTVYKSVPDGSGGWYVGGSFTVQGLSNLIHILADKTVDASFVPNPNSTVRALYLDGTTLYVGGSFTQINSQLQSRLAAINSSTGILQPWNPAPDGPIYSIMKNGNTVYVGGSFNSIDGQNRTNIAGIDVLTATASSWNPTANSTVVVLEVNGSEIIVGGSFTSIGGQNRSYLAALSLTTGNATTWNPSPNNSVEAIELNGTNAYVGGLFNNISGQPRNFIAEISLSTGAATTWNPNAGVTNPTYIAPIRTIKLIGTTVYAGGDFTTIGGQSRNYLAALNNTNGDALTWNPTPSGTVYNLSVNGTSIFTGGDFQYMKAPNRNYLMSIAKSNGVITTWNPSPNNTVEAIELNGANAYVGGTFNNIAGQPRNFIAEISLSTGAATTWNPNARVADPNNSTTVRTIKLIGTTVYAGGDFTTIGGQSRNYLAALNNDNGDALTWNPTPSGTVYNLSVNGTSIFTGGDFQYMKAPNRNYLMSIAKSNGVITTWNPSPNNTVEAIELNGANAYVGGTFNNIAGQPRNFIAEISLSTGAATTWNPNARVADPNNSTTVRTIKLIGTTVYAGGDFTTIGGQSRNYLAALNNDNGDALTWNPTPSGTVYNLSVNGTSIFTGGDFQYMKAPNRNYLMAIAKSNGVITTWNPSPNNTVEAIELNGANAYVGGTFNNIAGQPRNFIAEISLSTGAASTWNPNARVADPNNSTTVRTIKLIGTTVYAGGDFTTIGGQSRNYLAALNNTNGDALTWNPTPSGTVYNLSVNGTSIFTGGDFQYMKAPNRNYLMSIAKSNGVITTWNPSPNNTVEAIELNGANAYVGGTFNNIAGQPRNFIAEISLSTGAATTWNPNARVADPNNSTTVRTIKLIGTTVYAGGDFTTIGGQSRNYLAALNNDNGDALTWNPTPDGTVCKILQDNTDLIVIGTFSYMNNEQRNNLFSISKSTGLITAWNPGPDNTVRTLEMNGTNAYVGGDFTSISGQSRNRIAEISLSTGTAKLWNPDANSTVATIKRYGNTIYVGGSFTNIGGQSINYIAALNNSNGNATTWNPNANSNIVRLCVSDSILYVVGDYTNIAGQTRKKLSSFTLPDGNITTWNPDISGSITDLKITNSNVYISGSFNQVSGQNKGNIAAFTKKTGKLTGWNPNINGSVTSIIPKGKFIFAGGSFNVAGGQSCNGFAVINANSGIPELFFPKMSGQIYTMSAYNSLIYLGGDFSTINGINYGGLASISYPDGFFRPSLDKITPNSGGNGGDVSIAVFGNGFEDGTTIRLTKTGQPDIIIPDSMLKITDGIRINATVDLHNPVATGFWNVVVSVPNDTTMTLANAFTINPNEAPVIETNILGFQTIRLNTWQNYTISVTNKGNVDASGIPVYIALDSTILIDFANDFMVVDTLGNIDFRDTLFTYIPVDSLFGQPYSARVYPLILGNLPGGATDFISFKVKTTLSTQFKIKVWHDNPLYGSPFKPGWGACLDDIVTSVFHIVGIYNPVAGCGYNLFRTVLDPFIKMAIAGNIDNSQGNFGLTGAGGILTDYGFAVFKTVLGCFMAGMNDIEKADAVREIFIEALNLASGVSHGSNFAKDCRPVFNQISDFIMPVRIVTSFDPNEKQGPIGYGGSKYISSNNNVPYIIRFENLKTASAPAQKVAIIDTLDLNVFDPNTLSLGGIQIGDKIISVPFGLQSFSTDVNLAPSNNLILRIEAKFNKTNGILKWIFSSIDVNTLLPTEDPMAGFLPPNIMSPEGEGSVLLTVRTKNNIPNDAVIKNRAHIIFDANSSIVTNTWSNTIDNVKPVSHIAALPAVQFNDSTVQLHWTGNDTGSGVKSYAIYYSVNGGQFHVLTPYMYDTTVTFTGNLGSTYAFFSIANDSVGNIENMKNEAEATISFSPLVKIKDNFALNNMIVTVYPNPNQGNFNLSINTETAGLFDLSIADVFGRTIYTKKQNLSSGNNILPLNIKQSGMYFLKIGNQKEQTVKRVVVYK